MIMFSFSSSLFPKGAIHIQYILKIVLNVIKSFTPLTLKNYCMNYKHYNLLISSVDVLIHVNLHLNAFCVIPRCLISHLVNN
jgi:hypothetical protein